MSDQSKKPPSDDAVPPAKRPLENPKVDVKVTPKTRQDRDYADKVERNLKGEVEKTIKENVGGGHKEQIKKADEKAKDVGTKVDPSKVRQIEVDVSGRVGKERVQENTKVTPGPAPAAPAPAPASAPAKPSTPDKKK